jgi:hypothetical protein
MLSRKSDAGRECHDKRKDLRQLEDVKKVVKIPWDSAVIRRIEQNYQLQK